MGVKCCSSHRKIGSTCYSVHAKGGKKNDKKCIGCSRPWYLTWGSWESCKTGGTWKLYCNRFRPSSGSWLCFPLISFSCLASEEPVLYSRCIHSCSFLSKTSQNCNYNLAPVYHSLLLLYYCCCFSCLVFYPGHVNAFWGKKIVLCLRAPSSVMG